MVQSMKRLDQWSADDRTRQEGTTEDKAEEEAGGERDMMENRLAQAAGPNQLSVKRPAFSSCTG